MTSDQQFKAAAIKGALMIERDTLAMIGRQKAASGIDEYLSAATSAQLVQFYELLQSCAERTPA